MSKLSIEAAEEFAGRRLDRRFNYYLVDGELCTYGTWTDTCSGCFEGGEYMGLAHHYPFDKKRGCYIGAGCDECGYTGKRVSGWCSPVTPPTEDPKT